MAGNPSPAGAGAVPSRSAVGQRGRRGGRGASPTGQELLLRAGRLGEQGGGLLSRRFQHRGQGFSSSAAPGAQSAVKTPVVRARGCEPTQPTRLQSNRPGTVRAPGADRPASPALRWKAAGKGLWGHNQETQPVSMTQRAPRAR